MYVKNEQQYSFSQLRRDNPNTSFPLNPGADVLADYGVADVDIAPPDGQRWTGQFDGATPLYEDIPVVIPKAVPTWAAKLALIEHGLYDAAVAFIDGLSGTDSVKARVQWDNKPTFTRDNTLIQAFAADQGLTESDLDDLFSFADQQA